MITNRKHTFKLTHPLKGRQLSCSHFFCLLSLLLFMSSQNAQAKGDEVLIPCEIQSQVSNSYTWFPYPQGLPVKRVVVLAPGLNLNVRKLNSLASALTSMGSEVLSVDLTNPDETSNSWSKQIHQALCIARARAFERALPVIAVGHSLSSLVLLDLLTLPHHWAPQGFILLAPSLYPRSYTKVLNLLDWLPFGGLPSFNFKDYRVSDHTSFATYKELRLLREHFHAQSKFIKKWPPTLILMSEEDELLDFEQTSNFAQQHQMQIEALKPNARGRKTIEHLIVDPITLGSGEFSRMLQIMGKYFNQQGL